MIEKIARAMFNAGLVTDLRFDEIPEVVQEDYLEMAGAALAVLEPVIDSWSDVAEARQGLIDTLKAEKRQLAHEVKRLEKLIPPALERKYCTGCGAGFLGEHDCGRKRQ